MTTQTQTPQSDGDIKRNALLTFGMRVAGAGLLYCLQILLARLIGAEDYGIYALVWVWVIVLSQISCLGFNNAILRFFPRYILRNKQANAGAFFSHARLIALALASSIAIIGIAGTHLTLDWISQAYIWPIMLAMLCLPMFALGEIYEGAALSRSHIITALAPSFLLRPALIIAFMLLDYWQGFPMTVMTAMQCALLATWLTTCLQIIFTREKLNEELIQNKNRQAKPHRNQKRLWTKAAAPLFLLDGFYLITLNADIIILGFFVGPEKIAIYYAAIKTLALVAYIHFATSLVAARPFADLFAKKAAPQDINALYRKMTAWTFWPSLIAATGFYFASPLILSLFGEGFKQGQSIILILAIGLVVQGAVGPIQNLLNMAGQQKTSATSAFWAMAINIALNFLLIPKFGLMGAAIATTTGTIAQSLQMIIKANQTLGIRPLFWPSAAKQISEKTANPAGPAL